MCLRRTIVSLHPIVSSFCLFTFVPSFLHLFQLYAPPTIHTFSDGHPCHPPCITYPPDACQSLGKTILVQRLLLLILFFILFSIDFLVVSISPSCPRYSPTSLNACLCPPIILCTLGIQCIVCHRSIQLDLACRVQHDTHLPPLTSAFFTSIHLCDRTRVSVDSDNIPSTIVALDCIGS